MKSNILFWPIESIIYCAPSWKKNFPQKKKWVSFTNSLTYSLF